MRTRLILVVVVALVFAGVSGYLVLSSSSGDDPAQTALTAAEREAESRSEGPDGSPDSAGAGSVDGRSSDGTSGSEPGDQGPATGGDGSDPTANTPGGNRSPGGGTSTTTPTNSPGGTPGSGSKPSSPGGVGPLNQSPRPTYQAPTAGLTTVANALDLRNKGITAVVDVKKGLAISVPIEISVVFDGVQRITQNYAASTGNRLVFNYEPLDGKVRSQKVQISLYEVQPTGRVAFQMPLTISIEPLWDVRISTLNFNLVQDCDPIGASEPWISWFDPAGGRHSKHLSMSAGQSVTVNEFASTWTEVAVARGLIQSGVAWEEDDGAIGNFFDVGNFRGSGGFGLPFTGQGRPTAPLVPGATNKSAFAQDDSRGDCGAFLTYTTTYLLRTYPLL